MNLNFTTTQWKYIFLGLNILISMFGVLFISSGVVAFGGMGSVEGAYAITAIGSVVLGICFLGCFASLRESYLLSIIFIVTVAIGFIMQLAFMIALLVLKDGFVEMGVERVAAHWEKELKEPGAMDTLQYLYSCCGKESPQDYIQDADDVLPWSCCLYNDCADPANIFSKGCSGNIVKFFDVQSVNMILLSLALIVVEIFSLLAAFYMAKGVKNRFPKSEPIVSTE